MRHALALAGLAGGVATVAFGLAFRFIGDDAGDAVTLDLFACCGFGLCLGFRSCRQGGGFRELALA